MGDKAILLGLIFIAIGFGFMLAGYLINRNF